MDKYAQLNRLHHDRQLQVYMYSFMYVDPQKIPVKENFVATLNVSVNYKKMSIPGTVPKHQLIFSYICSEDYELDQNFHDTKKTRPHIPR